MAIGLGHGFYDIEVSIDCVWRWHWNFEQCLFSCVNRRWIGDVQDCQGVSASEMTYIVSSGALNSTHSLTSLVWKLSSHTSQCVNFRRPCVLSTVFISILHRSTWHTSEYQCPTSLWGSIFDPQLGGFWWFRDAGSAHSAHRPSLWPARRFGTLYQTTWEILDLGRDSFRRLLKMH